MTNPCPCGGETQVDHYDRPLRPVEWFLRCRACASISRAVATPEEAAVLTIEAPAIDLPDQDAP